MVERTTLVARLHPSNRDVLIYSTSRRPATSPAPSYEYQKTKSKRGEELGIRLLGDGY